MLPVVQKLDWLKSRGWSLTGMDLRRLKWFGCEMVGGGGRSPGSGAGRGGAGSQSADSAQVLQ